MIEAQPQTHVISTEGVQPYRTPQWRDPCISSAAPQNRVPHPTQSYRNGWGGSTTAAKCTANPNYETIAFGKVLWSEHV